MAGNALSSIVMLLTAVALHAETLTGCNVISVYDGDTVTAQCGGDRVRVRLWGIDAPERGQKPWGDDARDYLRRAVSGCGLTVQTIAADRYGRTVARLYCDGEDIGLLLVKRGKAVVYARYNRSAEYRDAQANAQLWQMGVWAEPGLHQTPEAWRRMRR